jgi:PleD family two-component response regulator
MEDRPHGITVHVMRADRLQEQLDAPRWPQTRTELEEWIRESLTLSPNDRARLVTAIDVVFTRHQRMWQESKEEAIQALSAGFTEKMTRLRTELSAKDATVSSIARYFEDLVDSLTERTHRDPKTKLMNFDWFMQQLESYLELEQRVRYCGVGLVDIARFKWYNDTLGHALGDRVITQVATLLSEHIRSDDVLATEMAASSRRRPDLHARFGGDEFCFLVPDLGNPHEAVVVADRFRRAVESYDWTRVDSGLAAQPVRVDVGVVSLRMGPVAERRFIARRLALQLVQRADQLMYDAKAEGSVRVHDLAMEVRGGDLVRLQ